MSNECRTSPECPVSVFSHVASPRLRQGFKPATCQCAAADPTPACGRASTRRASRPAGAPSRAAARARSLAWRASRLWAAARRPSRASRCQWARSAAFRLGLVLREPMAVGGKPGRE
eukprot:2214067-Rhodomonas_salina.1